MTLGKLTRMPLVMKCRGRILQPRSSLHAERRRISQSVIVRDSLAEAYINSGNLKEAEEYCQKLWRGMQAIKMQKICCEQDQRISGQMVAMHCD
jgi:hypothetical protein